jgi:hypothetical protein
MRMGVQNGFGPRVDEKVKEQIWIAKLSPMAVLIDGEQVRWILKWRKFHRIHPD